MLQLFQIKVSLLKNAKKLKKSLKIRWYFHKKKLVSLILRMRTNRGSTVLNIQIQIIMNWVHFIDVARFFSCEYLEVNGQGGFFPFSSTISEKTDVYHSFDIIFKF